MSAGRCTTIPRAFSYILPIQSLITGAVVYGIVYIFTYRSIVFILGVVAVCPCIIYPIERQGPAATTAFSPKHKHKHSKTTNKSPWSPTNNVAQTGLQFFLGIYCCLLGAKSGIYHRFIIPAWLVALAGIWIAPLYYLTAQLDSELKLKEALGAAYASSFPNEGDARLIWRAVGVAGSAVNWYGLVLTLPDHLISGPGHSL